MGLDMYWFRRGTKEERTEALIRNEDVKQQEIGYFRKFHDLNDYMGDMYPEDIGDFNCIELEITEQELAAMREFTDGHPDDIEELQNICNRIEEILKGGEQVVYWPWW